MKSFIVLVLVSLLLVGCSHKADKHSENQSVYRIGVVQLAKHPSLDATYEGLKTTLDEVIGVDGYRVDYKNAQGDIATADMIVSKFVDDDVALIYAIATNAAQAAYNGVEGTDIPVVFNAVTDPVDAGIVSALDKPGKTSRGYLICHHWNFKLR